LNRIAEAPKEEKPSSKQRQQRERKKGKCGDRNFGVWTFFSCLEL
jgi:hypothetical protein